MTPLLPQKPFEQASKASEENTAPGTAATRPPLFHRPWPWVILGMLAGIVLIGFLYNGRHVPVSASPQAGVLPSADSGPESAYLLDLKRAHNQGLEEELRRLQALLEEEPCNLPPLLGIPPDKSPLAPGYGANRQPSVKAPEGDAPPLPMRNATIVHNGTSEPLDLPVTVPHTVGELMEEATVFILSSYNGQLTTGSGFFVAPGVIATNRHVVQNPEAQILVGNKALGGMRQVQVIAYSNDENRDYALLSGALPKNVAPLHFAGEPPIRAERVSAWGFPGYIAEIDPKFKALLVDGDIKAVPAVVYSEGAVSVVLERIPPVILHTASLSQGNSGGPLVNAQGVVLGINTFVRKADQSYSQTNIALPGNDLARFMQEHGVPVFMTDAPPGAQTSYLRSCLSDALLYGERALLLCESEISVFNPAR